MDNKDNQEFDPIAGSQPEDNAGQNSGEYRGTGAGQTETVYVSAFSQETGKEDPEEKPREPEVTVEEPIRVKKGGKMAKRILAAAAALAVVAGSCAITAVTVNERWEERMEQLEDRFEAKLEELQEQIEDLDDVSVSGNLVYSDGMTPSQVYAMNVDTVVTVNNYVYSGGRGGQNVAMIYGTGSGFFISEDGYVVTNYHVVEGAQALSITTYAGEEIEAALVGYDEINDMAVLKIEAQGLKYAQLGSSGDLNVGDMVIAVGNALGELSYTMTVGYVSGTDRSVSTDGTPINMLQTDAAINSGNSGGPLFNMKGQVVGITTAKYSGETSSGASIEGIGFAIPIDDVVGMIDDLIQYGYVTNQAYLGVSVYDVDAATTNRYGVPQGAYVAEVVEGTCAERAGVQMGDIIVGVGSYEVDGLSSLQTVLRKFSAGDTSTITVYREGRRITLEITFDERPADVNSGSTQETEPNEMPENGDFEEWYEYFDRYFNDNGQDDQD